ncbi:MAG: DUF2949 domain-containing protein [Synechococcales bacterium]|nr:DUF2949 domain-containing protein [Synechococcales bacterium]
MKHSQSHAQFLQFLRHEFRFSDAEIAVVHRHQDLDNGPLSIMLWKYGLITLEQLSHIFDWLENRIHPSLIGHI